MFQEALQFKGVIIFYYNKHNIVKISGKVPFFLTWHNYQIIIDYLSLVVSACVCELI
jgi:hypothetical protein